MVSVELVRRAAPAVVPDPHASAPTTGPYAGHVHFDETITPVLITDFDVDAYTRRGTDRLEVDMAAIEADGPLGPQVRLALGVLQRLEGTALAESRAMLATTTGNEARITAFLATWHVDRFWQSRALRDVLEAGGGPEPADLPPPTAIQALRRLHVDQVQPLLTPLWNVLAGESLAAGHMARMAIQEASLQELLRALAELLDGEARRVVETVIDRHDAAVEFFTAEARARITRSRAEAVTARAVLSLLSPLAGGYLMDPALRPALAVLGTEAPHRAALRRARFEITRLLPGPDLPDPLLAIRPRPGV